MNKDQNSAKKWCSAVRVEVDHAHFQTFVRGVNFHRHDGYVHLVRNGFRRGQGEFEALVRRVPTRPALGEPKASRRSARSDSACSAGQGIAPKSSVSSSESTS